MPGRELVLAVARANLTALRGRVRAACKNARVLHGGRMDWLLSMTIDYQLVTNGRR